LRGAECFSVCSGRFPSSRPRRLGPHSRPCKSTPVAGLRFTCQCEVSKTFAGLMLIWGAYRLDGNRRIEVSLDLPLAGRREWITVACVGREPKGFNRLYQVASVKLS
jgi:hypothetical protein